MCPPTSLLRSSLNVLFLRPHEKAWQRHIPSCWSCAHTMYINHPVIFLVNPLKLVPPRQPSDDEDSAKPMKPHARESPAQTPNPGAWISVFGHETPNPGAWIWCLGAKHQNPGAWILVFRPGAGANSLSSKTAKPQNSKPQRIAPYPPANLMKMVWIAN